MRAKVLEIYFFVTFLLVFHIEIGAFEVTNPMVPPFSCLNHINVPLDEGCLGLISSEAVTVPATSGMFVYLTQEDIPSALNANQVKLVDTLNGSGSWMYGLYEPLPDEKGHHQLICWSQIYSEDLFDPSLEGWQDTTGQPLRQYNTLRKKIYGTWKGTLDPLTNSQYVNLGNWSCWQDINTPDSEATFPNNSNQLYDTISFTPTQTGWLTIVPYPVGDAEALEFDPIIAVYGSDGFNPNYPCENLRWVYGNSLQPNNLGGIGNADAEVGPWSLSKIPIGSFQINAQVGEKYTFLVTPLFPLDTASDFTLYFFLQDENGNEIFPFAQEEASDQLRWDSSFAHLDLKTTDIEEIYLSHLQILGEDQYPGSSADGIDPEWFHKGSQWLGTRLHQDSGFIDLVQLETAPFLMDSMLYHYGFRPLVQENCSTWEVSVSDSFILEGECVESIIERTFVVKDYETRTDLDTAVIQLIFRTPNLDDVRLPPYAVYLNCEDWPSGEFSIDHLPGPNITGYPFLHTLAGFQPFSSGIFSRRDISIGASYEDRAIVVKNDYQYSFRRAWTIYDWCQPWTTIEYHQLIHIGDWTPPVIDTASISVISRSKPDQCVGTLTISPASATDGCAEIIQTIKISNELGEEIAVGHLEGETEKKIWTINEGLIEGRWKDEELVLEGLGWGIYEIKWIVEDEQKNADTFQRQVLLEDAIAPSCLTEDTLRISLHHTSIQIVARELDGGSWDNCYDLAYKISLDSPTSNEEVWLDQVMISCDREDLSFPVFLKVSEQRSNEEGPALSAICQTFIQLIEAVRPACREIEQLLFCDELLVHGGQESEEYWDTYFRDSITLGQVLAEPYCGAVELMENLETKVDLESCGYGRVIRTYAIVRPSAENFWADTCTMTLNIGANHWYQIDFPADQSDYCPKSWSAMPLKYSEWGCDLMTASVHDEQLVARAEGCYQIQRIFSVINWCEYVPECTVPWTLERRDWNADGYEGDALSILVDFEDIPSGNGSLVDSNQTVLWILQGASGVAIDSFTFNQYLHLNSCERDSFSHAGHGFFKYQQVIRITDTVPPVILFDQETYIFSSFSNDRLSGCAANVLVSGTITDGCTSDSKQVFIQEVKIRPLDSNQAPIEVTQNNYFQEDTIFGVSLDLSLGEYELTIQAEDGCGNLEISSTDLSVVDAKGPAPICIEGLAVELMPDLTGEGAIAEVFATDFLLQTPVEDCTGDTEDYHIVHLKPLQLDPLTEMGSKNLVLHCRDIDFSGLPLTVAIIAKDSAGNRDYCTSQLVLQDNLEICGYGIISGQVRTGGGQAVSEVTITLNDSLKVTRTLSDGSYSIGPVSWGGDYHLLPQKKGKEPEGISTLDIVMLSRHLLGEKLLKNPYQVIAADVNLSNSISTLDIIWMRKMILKQIDKFPHEKSWRFIPGDWECSDISRLWANPFSEITEIEEFGQEKMNQDFIAVKIGDVNFSFLNEIEARDNRPLIISYQEEMLIKGNRYEITFYGDREEVTGFQFELVYNGLQIEELVEGKVKAEHLNRTLGEENKVLISWNGIGASGCLFTLVVMAKESGLLSDKLRVGTGMINPEGYSEQEEVMAIELRSIDSSIKVEPFYEVSLRSNPIQREAYFDFSLSEDQLVTLNILDNNGKVVYVGQKNIMKGESTWVVEFAPFITSGLYYYQIEFNQAWHSGKMIRLNH